MSSKSQTIVLFALFGLIALCILTIIGTALMMFLSGRSSVPPLADRAFCNTALPQQLPNNPFYDGTEATIHPILIVNWQDSLLTDHYPPEWEIPKTDEAELVACVVRSRQLVETCRYTIETEGGDSEERLLRTFTHTVTITLYEARSGESLNSTNLVGVPPAPCSESETFPAAELAPERSGEPVPITAIIEWLTPYVETGE